MENIYDFIINTISNVGTFSILLNCLLIVVESIIPPLPLALFITILYVNYGPLIGFFVSWVFTIIGCVLSYYLFQTIFKNSVDKYLRKSKIANKFLMLFDNIKFSILVLIIAIPFTPAFLVNIIAGVSKMNFKKFLPAIMIGKISLVLFWGYIGTSLIESIKDPIILVRVALLMLIIYIISRIINIKLKLD